MKNHKNGVFNRWLWFEIWITFFILLFYSGLGAEPVNWERASQVAGNWLRRETRPLGAVLSREIEEIRVYRDSTDAPVYYVADLKDTGYIIVAPDDMVEPIIAIVPAGNFNAADDDPLGALVNQDLPARLRAVQNLQLKIRNKKAIPYLSLSESRLLQKASENQDKWTHLDSSTVTKKLTGISEIRVPPILVSTWGQTTVGNISGGITCYNYYTPNNWPCGCVATAMSQLMRYHEYPGSYVWSNMPLQPDGSITLIQRQAIGGLCFNVAEAIDTVYGPTSSSASLYDGDIQLVSTFGYNNSIHGDNGYNDIGAGLTAMINPNLDAGLPVILGVHGSGGHAVVCDGYGYNASTLYHHLNMGWSGYHDAWYNLPEVDADPPDYDYEIVDTCVYNVFITGSGEIISGRVTDMGANPVEGAVVSAQKSGGGLYQTTTNSNGIYALVGVPSSGSYTLSVAKPGHAFINQFVSTGLSSDGQAFSGNVWSVDFDSQNATPPSAYDDTIEALSGMTETISLYATDEGYPDPPGELTYIITSLPEHGRLYDTNNDLIVTVPYELPDSNNVVDYWPCSYFTGEDSFQFKANDGGTPTVGGDSNIATITIDVDNTIYSTYEPSTNSIAQWPMMTSYHDSRTQVIYLAAEIGEAKTITHLALNIFQAPGQTLNNWTIRMKHTSLNEYPIARLESDGWTMVYQANESAAPIGWRYFAFQTPFAYNGTDNLMIDFSHNNSYYSTDGLCYVSETYDTRVALNFSDSTDGDPLDWGPDTFSYLYSATAVPNLKLISTLGGDPVAGDFEPDCDVDLMDFTDLTAAWLTTPADEEWDPNCDISSPPDSIINLFDLQEFAHNWLTTIN
ncbi:MAG: C10 family peptidase [Sedimentisphaerales bacterium]|nr:C10 family peptidase [Sedimentisphaerales bacterium]